MQALAAPDQVTQRLVVANIEHDVNVVFVFEVAVEPHHVFVVERAVDLDLAGELLAGLRAGQVCLGNDFEGPGQGTVLFGLDR